MLFDLLDGVLGADFFEKSLNIVCGIAVPLLLFFFSFFLESIFVGLVGNNTWILSSLLSVIGLLYSVLDGFKELLLAVVVNQNVLELEACDGVLWDGLNKLVHDFLVLDELLDLSSGNLARHVLEVSLHLLVA